MRKQPTEALVIPEVPNAESYGLVTATPQHKKLDTYGNVEHTIQFTDSAASEEFTLPSTAYTSVLGGREREQLLAARFPTAFGEITVPGVAILQAMEQSTPDEAPLFIGHDGDIIFQSSGKTTAHTHTSLYRLFAASRKKSDGSLQSFSTNVQNHLIAGGFVRARGPAAAALGLELAPAELTLPPITEVNRQQHDATELIRRSGWLDAECSVVSISPANLIQSMLRSAAYAQSLWSVILPHIRSYRDAQKATDDLNTPSSPHPSPDNLLFTSLDDTIKEEAPRVRLRSLMSIASLGLSELRRQDSASK